MLYDQTFATWTDIVNKTHDAEFDFVAFDNKGQIGIFSTFNRAYRPDCVTDSLELFLSLDKLIETLPETTTAISAMFDKDISAFISWKKYASQGFFAYDNQDVHRSDNDKQNQYDIIYRPAVPVYAHEVYGLNDYSSIIPYFDLTFGDNIKFDKLKTALVD